MRFLAFFIALILLSQISPILSHSPSISVSVNVHTGGFEHSNSGRSQVASAAELNDATTDDRSMYQKISDEMDAVSRLNAQIPAMQKNLNAANDARLAREAAARKAEKDAKRSAREAARKAVADRQAAIDAVALAQRQKAQAIDDQAKYEKFYLDRYPSLKDKPKSEWKEIIHEIEKQ